MAIGTQLVYDGEHVEIVDIRPSARGNEIVLCNSSRSVGTASSGLPESSPRVALLLPVGEFVVEPGAEDEAEPLGPGPRRSDRGRAGTWC